MSVTDPPAQNVVGPEAVTFTVGGVHAVITAAVEYSEVPSNAVVHVPSPKLVAVVTTLSPAIALPAGTVRPTFDRAFAA